MSERRTQRLLGWSFTQWAIAAGRLGRPEVTLMGAHKLRNRWLNSNPANPGEFNLLLDMVEQHMDWTFAADLFALPMPSMYQSGAN